jgi:hypothetical protein
MNKIEDSSFKPFTIRTIQELHKNDKFQFNSDTYTVKRKWINDDKPLIAYNEDKHIEHRFFYEGLEVEVIK